MRAVHGQSSRSGRSARRSSVSSASCRRGQTPASVQSRNLRQAVFGEHADCDSAYALRQPVTVTVASRYLKRWCLASGAGSHTAWFAAGFLIARMQEVDQVSQFLDDFRGNGSAGFRSGCGLD